MYYLHCLMVYSMFLSALEPLKTEKKIELISIACFQLFLQVFATS